MAYLDDIIVYLNDIGFFSIVLPFILIFAIIFAILEKTKILGYEGKASDEIPKRNINLIVSFAIAFIAIGSSQIINVITKSLGPIVVLILVSVFLLLFMSIFGHDMADKSTPGTKYFAWSVAAILVLIFIWSIGWWDDVISYINANVDLYNVLGIIFLFGFIAGLVLWMTGSSEPKGNPSEKKEK